MSPIQQMLLGVGAVATKTYVDDVFSTFLYTGTGSAQTINNGIDLANEGGMVWFKSRTTGGSSYNNHSVVDTERVDSSGRGKSIYPNLTDQEFSPENTSNFITTSFNSNGYTTATNPNNATNTQTLASWSFRKAPGFFDVVTYTGNGSNRDISHSLGCVPGMILVKCTSHSADWAVLHTGTSARPEDDGMYLNASTAMTSIMGTDDWWDGNNRKPTSTTFGVGTNTRTNHNTRTYVAYLFAGGESTAATARSVKFDGSDDYIRTPDHSDLDLDTNQFTIEMWVKSSTDPSSGNMNLVGQWGGNDRGYAVRYSLADQSFNGWGFQYCTNEQGSDVNTINGSTGIDDGQWHHLAVVRESSTIKLYTDGNLSSSTSISGSLHITNSERDFYVGSDDSDNRYTGNVSNVRVVVGTALYTSSFKPPTEPLTNVTNTKLLCCNNSSVTGSTVSPGTFYSGGGPTASSNSPFDDPAGFSFGDAGDQNVIKCGSYVGNGSSTGPEINLGWEPQWVMFKATDRAAEWSILDCMRGIVTGGDDAVLYPSESDAEVASSDIIEVSATGFRLKTSNQLWNQDTKNYIFTAIRRSDGYVGKPPELGTGVFAMDTSSASSVIPTFDSTFPVDFGLKRKTASTDHWLAGYRLLGQKSLSPDRNNSETDSGASLCWDSNLGFGKTFGTLNQGWMWKRHAGFTVCAWEGDGVIGRQIAHDMNKIPEMIWLKKRTGTARNWPVYHKGLDGGSSPEEKVVWLNLTNAESDSLESWNNTAPTSTHFTIHGTANEPNTNTDGEDYIAMLFASVDGISKVGSYTGNGQNWHGIEVGFAPRFYMIKKVSGTGDWFIVDNTRGLDENLLINETDAQAGPQHIGTPSSTTWYIGASGSTSILNTNNEKYIYYVHA